MTVGLLKFPLFRYVRLFVVVVVVICLNFKSGFERFSGFIKTKLSELKHTHLKSPSMNNEKSQPHNKCFLVLLWKIFPSVRVWLKRILVRLLTLSLTQAPRLIPFNS